MPKPRFFLTPTAGVSQLLKRRPTLHFAGRTRQHWQTWQRRLRAALKRLMGPVPAPVPLRIERIERTLFAGYIRENIYFNPDPFSTVAAYVFTPTNIRRGQRRPAILCAHGHGTGKRSQVDPRELYNRIAVELCRKLGAIVIAPDWRSFGERSDSPQYIQHWGNEHGADGCDLAYMLYGYFGYQMLTLNVADARRCIDYLQQRRDVDPSRIGMLGLSFGGTMTTFTAARDRRIKAAVISGYLSTIADALGDRGRGNTCGSQFLLGLRAVADIPDIAGLIAPRPTLIQIGAKDSCFIESDALKAYRHLQRIYRAAGASMNLALDHFDGAHEINVQPALNFLSRHLTP